MWNVNYTLHSTSYIASYHNITISDLQYVTYVRVLLSMLGITVHVF